MDRDCQPRTKKPQDHGSGENQLQPAQRRRVSDPQKWVPRQMLPMATAIRGTVKATLTQKRRLVFNKRSEFSSSSAVTARGSGPSRTSGNRRASRTISGCIGRYPPPFHRTFPSPFWGVPMRPTRRERPPSSRVPLPPDFFRCISRVPPKFGQAMSTATKLLIRRERPCAGYPVRRSSRKRGPSLGSHRSFPRPLADVISFPWPC